jgi:hypothetical protein
MVPRNYYVAPLSTFQGLSQVQWEATHLGLGTTDLHFGSVDFRGVNDKRASFESQAEVTSVGTMFHSKISARVAQLLEPHGVLSTDGVMDVFEKVFAKRGGVTLHY